MAIGDSLHGRCNIVLKRVWGRKAQLKQKSGLQIKDRVKVGYSGADLQTQNAIVAMMDYVAAIPCDFPSQAKAWQ